MGMASVADEASSADGEHPWEVLQVPIGIDADGTRTESDSIGDVEVRADRYWGAQTERSLHHFDVSDDRMPVEVYRAFGYLKKAAAIVNARAGLLPRWKADVIAQVCDEVIAGDLDDHFPGYVWQSGSGTQANMNVNEVISNRCIQLLGAQLGSKHPIHPNDDVNMSQSSNDTFVTAMHIAAYQMTTRLTLPALGRLQSALADKSAQWMSVVKVGRTHLQDATPLTVGQEWSGYAAALADAIDFVEYATQGLLPLAMGGTAVGTGLNAPAGFDVEVAAVITELTGDPFVSAPNKFAAQATLDRVVRAHAALKATAVTLFKIANDMRWLGSGPRAGLMEINFPANEPGSSIMPGKVNPSQAESMLMICIEVMASDVAVQLGGAEGNFELNVFRPLLINNYLHSALVLGNGSDRFREFMIEGAELNTAQIATDLGRSLMLVTALAPILGYDKATAIAHRATRDDLPLRDAALAEGVDPELFDRIVIPTDMTHPHG